MVVMFADLAGYTALTDVHGDDEAVSAEEAVATLKHEGATLYFCSTECLTRFLIGTRHD